MITLAVILTAAFGSLTTITIGSLIFADRRAKEDVTAERDVKIWPWVHPNLPDADANKACPLCGTNSTDVYGVTAIPVACPTPRNCTAKNKSHLHASCKSCKSEFFVRTHKL